MADIQVHGRCEPHFAPVRAAFEQDFAERGERGVVDLAAPVARYWPEFAQAGKGDMPVRFLLTHQAGLPAIARPLPPGANLRSWETMTEALAQQAPWWEPGSRFGYHVNTF